MQPKRFLGIIPARGGSKGIPLKNIKMIAGKPLIAWSIEAALRSKLLDDLAVSTEDEGIADISRRFGAQVIKRPAELASDESSTLSVLQHALTVRPAENIVLLQPTSPVREEGLIDACIGKFQELGVDNLATGFVCKFMEYGSYSKRRQELKGFFYDDGNVYVIRSGLVQAGKMLGDKVAKHEISREQNIEIDDEFDFWMVEQVLRKRSGQKE